MYTCTLSSTVLTEMVLFAQIAVFLFVCAFEIYCIREDYPSVDGRITAWAAGTVLVCAAPFFMRELIADTKRSIGERCYEESYSYQDYLLYISFGLAGIFAILQIITLVRKDGIIRLGIK